MSEQNKTGFHFDHSYARLPDVFFTKVSPTPVKSPKLIIFNEAVAHKLGLHSSAFQSKEGLEILAGNKLPEEALPIAQAYAGHQYENFRNLGDGRAILLGEQITPDKKRYDLQYKGPGVTPYSHRGDGRASTGPMLREYIISEAMQALGIPGTLSLSVVTTGESIYRGVELPGAILMRVAKSHLRVGTFQYAANWGTIGELRELADYTIDRHYPEVAGFENPYLAFFEKVVDSQAQLIANWQLVGFIHGVQNTDNVSICGETIDYGPCAFMDTYDPNTVFSSIDRNGRYAYGNQPYIGGWNLARLAESLLALFAEDEKDALDLAQKAIGKYNELFQEYWLTGMRKKLGILNEEVEDLAIVQDLFTIMEEAKADFTNTFRSLTFNEVEVTELTGNRAFEEWKERWMKRLERQDASSAESKECMKENNPAVIPRNHRVEEALDAAVDHGDFTVMERLVEVLSHPYAHTKEQEAYTTYPKTLTDFKTFCGT